MKRGKPTGPSPCSPPPVFPVQRTSRTGKTYVVGTVAKHPVFHIVLIGLFVDIAMRFIEWEVARCTLNTQDDRLLDLWTRLVMNYTLLFHLIPESLFKLHWLLNLLLYVLVQLLWATTFYLLFRALIRAVQKVRIGSRNAPSE
jgi:hypothetical protein